METAITANYNEVTTLRKAALVAGLAVLIMAFTVPVAEFYIFPTLPDYDGAAQTITNIAAHSKLFSTAIFIHCLTVVCDVIVAWALYIFLKPVNRNLALLTAWFRLVYTAFNITAILNLVQVLTAIKSRENLSFLQSDMIGGYVLLHLKSFDLQWRVGLVFFGIYLCLLAWLILKAEYVPRIIGVFLIIAGLGYVVDNLKYFFYPMMNTGFLWFTYFGELVFMVWLLIKGSRIRKLYKA